MEEAIRAALLGLVKPAYEAAFPGIPLAIENEPFEFNDAPPRYTEFEIQFLGGAPIGAAAQPRTRLSGYAYVTVWAKAGLGTLELAQIKDWFAQLLGYRNLGAVRLQAPDPVGPTRSRGWYSDELKFYFYADEP